MAQNIAQNMAQNMAENMAEKNNYLDRSLTLPAVKNGNKNCLNELKGKVFWVNWQLKDAK